MDLGPNTYLSVGLGTLPSSTVNKPQAEEFSNPETQKELGLDSFQFNDLGIQEPEVPEGLFDCKSQQRFSGGTDTPTIQQARPLTCSSVHLLQSAATCATSLAKLPLTTLHNALHLCFLHSSWHRLFSHVYKAGTTSALVLLNSSIWHGVPNIVGT